MKVFRADVDAAREGKGRRRAKPFPAARLREKIGRHLGSLALLFYITTSSSAGLGFLQHPFQ